MKILLAGASGLVGGHILTQAVARGIEPVLVGRRSLSTEHTEILTTFEEVPELPPADAAICTLGTTIAAAGSRSAFYAVDHDAVLAFAAATRDAGVEHLLVVTAVGANPKAGIYYSRVKGEVERDLESLEFRCLDIAQPGLLIGDRDERRPVEQLMQLINPVARHFLPGPLSRYAGIDAEAVASALLSLSEDQDREGAFRYENAGLLAAASLP